MSAAAEGRSVSPCGETAPQPGRPSARSRRPLPARPAPCPARGCAAPAPSAPAARRPPRHRPRRRGSASAAGRPRSAAASRAAPWPPPNATGRRAAAPACSTRAPLAAAATPLRPAGPERRARTHPPFAAIAVVVSITAGLGPGRGPGQGPEPQPRRPGPTSPHGRQPMGPAAPPPLRLPGPVPVAGEGTGPGRSGPASATTRAAPEDSARSGLYRGSHRVVTRPVTATPASCLGGGGTSQGAPRGQTDTGGCTAGTSGQT